jgi:hypothetical protein
MYIRYLHKIFTLSVFDTVQGCIYTHVIGVERSVQTSVGVAAKSALHFAAISTWVVVIINHKV